MARKMKDSGIPWVGKITEDWEVKKIASLYNVRNQKVSEKDFPALSVSKLGVVPQLSHVAKSNDTDNRKLVRAGDFAINSRSDRRGACGIAKQDGSVSLINIVLKPLENMEPGYFDWLFHSSIFADEFYKWGKGIDADVWSTHWTMMKKIRVPYPPLSEQKRIADYLDKMVGRIDGLREKISREIERLGDYKKLMISEAVCRGLDKTAEMKDSGIPWVGKIPAGWEVTRLQWHLEEVNEINTPVKCNFILSLTNDRGVIPYSEKGNQGNKAKEDVSSYKLAYKDCIIANSMNIIIGSVGLSNYDGCVSPVYYVFRARNGVCIKFINYIFQTSIFQRELRRHAKGILEIRLRISAWAILKQKVPIPPLAEQKRIAEYIDKQVAKIDALIEKRKAELERLEALKRSIICECVTGKKEVAA